LTGIGLIAVAVAALACAVMAAEQAAVKAEGAPRETTGAEAAKVDPQAAKTLKAMAEFAQGLKGFKCEVILLMTSEMEGMKQEITTTYSFAMERPNKLALRYVRGMAGNTIVCDGKKMVTYAGMLKRYEERDAPRTLEDLFQMPGPMAGNMLFLDNLLRANVYAAIMDGVSTARYVGKDQVDGLECDHLMFTQADFDWELWVTTGAEPVVLKAQSDMSKGLSVGAEGPEAKGMKMVMLNRLSGWQLNPDLPSDTFVFKPPEGARKTDSLFESDEDERPELQVQEELKKLPAAFEATEPATIQDIPKGARKSNDPLFEADEDAPVKAPANAGSDKDPAATNAAPRKDAP
jgi:hypothetical protein